MTEEREVVCCLSLQASLALLRKLKVVMQIQDMMTVAITRPPLSSAVY